MKKYICKGGMMLSKASLWTWQEIKDFSHRASVDFYDIGLCEYNGGHYYTEIESGLFKCSECPMIERR
jgi:hypothetical protein